MSNCPSTDYWTNKGMSGNTPGTCTNFQNVVTTLYQCGMNAQGSPFCPLEQDQVAQSGRMFFSWPAVGEGNHAEAFGTLDLQQGECTMGLDYGHNCPVSKGHMSQALCKTTVNRCQDQEDPSHGSNSYFCPDGAKSCNYK